MIKSHKSDTSFVYLFIYFLSEKSHHQGMIWLQLKRKCTVLPFMFFMTAMIFYLQLQGFKSKVELIRIKDLSPFKQIVWYQLYHGGLRNDARGMNFSECEYSRCQIDFIDNAVQMDDLFSSADAILFQGGRMPKSPPKRSHDDQVYIFVDNESPLHLHSNGYLFPSWNGIINWTMTYRLDSEMKYTYGAIASLPESAKSDKNYSEIYRKKTKDAAWLVSDCHTESKREKFVAKLKNYINVDVYGRCGKLKNCTKEEGKLCFQKIANDYKFYLSFENSVCEDYMTEKVFTWFGLNIINIVRGARSYNKILPSKTYINTDSFKTVEQLGFFLKVLSKTEEAYTSMLRLKDQYTVIAGKEKKHEAYCDLCKRLHNLDENRKTYKSISEWWLKNRCVRYPKDIR